MALLSAFNPHDLPEATIRALATGRDDSLADIISTVRSNLGRKSLQHLIVSAPRGFGKSFLMRHVQLELLRIAREESLPLAVVLMPEEMPHVREPHTFIQEITRTLLGRPGSEAELSWHDNSGAWRSAVDDLVSAVDHAAGDGSLLVALVENFDILLHQAFSSEVDLAALRTLLTRRGGRLMLVAASASGAVDHDYDRPLFKAFREIALSPWTQQECLDFFDRQQKEAGREPLSGEQLNRARAVTAYIGGTPRLATLLGEALLRDDLLRAADLLAAMVDELTPYYKHRIESLPGRSQKLLDALLRFGEPATPSELARRVKARGQSDIAQALSVLSREQVVIAEKAKGSAEKLYRVADRVFAQYYRKRIVAHEEAGCPLDTLVDLLSDFYPSIQLADYGISWLKEGLDREAELVLSIIKIRNTDFENLVEQMYNRLEQDAGVRWSGEVASLFVRILNIAYVHFNQNVREIILRRIVFATFLCLWQKSLGSGKEAGNAIFGLVDVLLEFKFDRSLGRHLVDVSVLATLCFVTAIHDGETKFSSLKIMEKALSKSSLSERAGGDLPSLARDILEYIRANGAAEVLSRFDPDKARFIAEIVGSSEEFATHSRPEKGDHLSQAKAK